MKLEQRYPSYFPLPSNHDDNDAADSEPFSHIVAQDPQSKEGSQDSSGDTEQEDSEPVP